MNSYFQQINLSLQHVDYLGAECSFLKRLYYLGLSADVFGERSGS